jgi:hypothetical protein
MKQLGKFGKINEIKLNPLCYNLCLMGQPGIGKSTLIKEVCERLSGEDSYIALDIGREDGHSSISGIRTEKVEDYQTLMEVFADIIENKESDYSNLKTVVIDTLDEYCEICEKESVRQYNRKYKDKQADTVNQAWGGFGKGLDKTIDLMLDALWELKKVGVSFILVAHVRNKEIDDPISGVPYTILTSNISQKYFNAFRDKMHVIGLAYIDREIIKNKTGKKNLATGADITKGKVVSESRMISFRDDSYAIDSKSRFSSIIPEIEFDPDCFIKAIQDAILAEHNKSGKSIAETQAKQQEEAKEAEKAATEYSKSRKKNKSDSEQNENLIAVIQSKFPDATPDEKAQVKTVMGEYGMTNFKGDNIPTEALKQIVDILGAED